MAPLNDASAFTSRLDHACKVWDQVNPQEYAYLARVLRQIPTWQQFDLLAPAFLNDSYIMQQYAGRLLVELKPPCVRPLAELLSSLLPRWNASVEQLPVYLASVFGLDSLHHALDALDAQRAQGSAKTKIVRYWLRLVPTNPGHEETDALST